MVFFPCRNWGKEEESRGKRCVLKFFLWWSHHVWERSKALWVWHIYGLWFNNDHCGAGLMGGCDHIGHLFQDKLFCGFTTDSAVRSLSPLHESGFVTRAPAIFSGPWDVPSAPADLCHVGLWIHGRVDICLPDRDILGWGGTFPNNPSILLDHPISPLSFSSSTPSDLFLFLSIQVRCHFYLAFWMERANWWRFSLMSYLAQKNSACLYLCWQTTSSL